MATLIIWAAIILGIGGFILWLYLAGKSAGTNAIARDVAETTADVTQAQAQAQADAPRSKDAIIDRLRKGGGL
jgi:hypothetical protein